MNPSTNSFNFSVSGWTGSGATSLSLILCKLFGHRYLHMGGIFRYIGMQLGYSEDGISRPKFDYYIEPIIGATVDKYRDHMLLESNDILVDSDLGTFLVGKHPKVFSIFLKSSFEERAKKVIKDDREDAVANLKERDKTNKEFYVNLHGIDIYNEDLINKKFTLVIDNSYVSLEEEVRMVAEEIINTKHYSTKLNLEEILERTPEEILNFAKLDKKRYKEELEKEQLVVGAKEIVLDIAKLYPEDVENYPENVQKIFLGLKD